MATRLENLETSLDNMALQLADITANPKPSYSINGQSVSWVEYQRFLLDGMAALRVQIQVEDGPVCHITQGVS